MTKRYHNCQLACKLMIVLYIYVNISQSECLPLCFITVLAVIKFQVCQTKAEAKVAVQCTFGCENILGQLHVRRCTTKWANPASTTVKATPALEILAVHRSVSFCLRRIVGRQFRSVVTQQLTVYKMFELIESSGS